ncbi:hypothetical protein [Pseudomonas sp. LRF_L74]|uniref:hypothetical protein n=1 Tax=Pseudomonas sp. LRF_L74 TaxID=3369422 RepID=UPI003F643A78
MTRRIPLLLAASFLAFDASALELAKFPQVFDAANGISVKVAPSTDNKQALVQISGINHELNDVVFLTEVKTPRRDELAYTTTLDGSRYNLLHKSNDWGSDYYALYLPGTKEQGLRFNENASKATKPAELLALYEQQKGKGVQEKLATFDREKRVRHYQERLEETDKSASDSCGATIKTEVDWQAIDDPLLKTTSVASFCGEVANQLDNLCGSDSAFKAQAKTIKGIECRFDSAMKLREQDGVLQFTTAKDAPNQGDFVKNFLLNR